MKPYDLVSAIFKEGMVRKFFSAQFREKSGKYFFWLFFFFLPTGALEQIQNNSRTGDNHKLYTLNMKIRMILVESTMFKLEKSLKFLFLIKESKAKMCLKIPQKTYLLACPLSP